MVENESPRKSAFAMPGNYRIRVRGLVDPKWSDWLGGMTITTRQSQSTSVTDLVGRVADQAALSGILNALYEMHLPILQVEFLGDHD
jgi:hypothetical protein